MLNVSIRMEVLHVPVQLDSQDQQTKNASILMNVDVPMLVELTLNVLTFLDHINAYVHKDSLEVDIYFVKVGVMVTYLIKYWRFLTTLTTQ